MTNIVLIIVLTCLSAYGDSRGFVWTDRAWNGGTPVWPAISRAFVGYGFGITTYVLAVRQLKLVSDIGVAAQATGWFLLTIVGVAFADGRFMSWGWIDRTLSILTVALFALVIYRVG